ncbi:AAA family ATPase [Methanothrix soehngenii]|jgi:DNA sulfur modification protein DndD|uniref:Chromosome segregation protein n=1 Tax=Candidatus Methanofastidiosum methylothiophilum TaxID=1705564 RepID=A0A150J334_9EURY|nr:MAG: chromosome segregation protein [Candidatus Methanofastidiosum methylthiophilus]
MQIQKIDIFNFGPFYGKHGIQFPENSKGVHIIRGGNGQGKTSLQRAVVWGLYNNVYDRMREKIRETSLLNQRAFREGNYHFGVTIYFTHEKKRWILNRKMEAKKHTDKSYDEGMVLTLAREGEPIQDAQNEIERIIPHEVSRFYFFDGEMLRDYEELLEENSRSRLLKNSIELIIGVPHFKNAIDDLTAIRSKLEKRLSQAIKNCGGKDYKELADDLNFISERIEEKNDIITKLKEQLIIVQEEISSKKLELARIKDVQEMGEERLRLEREIKKEENNRIEKLKELQKCAAGLYKTLLIPVSEKAILSLDEKNKASYDKYNRKQRLLEKAEVLQNGISEAKCKTCGTILNKEKLDQFENELKIVKEDIILLTHVPEPNLEFERHKSRLELLANQASKREEFVDIDKYVNIIDAKLATYKSELSSILEKLKGIDADQPRKLVYEIESRINEEGRLQGELKVQVEENDGLKELKKELDTKIRNIDKKEINNLNNAIDNVDPLIKVFEKAIALYRDDKKHDIEYTASEIFKKIRSKDTFDHLKINDQYGLSIVTNEGTILDRSEWRSSGEEQLVALALIGALNKCAQIKAPVFMDTPFGRLDINHGERVLRYISELADQLVLLVTDREFREGDIVYLNGSDKSDHSIVFRNEQEGSAILINSNRG